MNKQSPVEIVTFGCRLNTYESEVMKNLAAEAGLRDTYIVNTCGVTAEAKRQARQSIRRLKKTHPHMKIIVTGCAAQMDPQMFDSMPEVDRIIGNEEKMKLESYQGHQEERVYVNDIMSVKETALHLISGFEEKARAFVQVQNGCNHRCTFCQIPYGRGNSRSVTIGDIVNQVKELVHNGCQEIVLTGVDITDYGLDLPGKPTLGQMMQRLLNLVPDLKRLRLSSIDPVEVDEELWQLIENEPRLMPHLHISLQAGDNMILKRMKRRHLREDVIAFCKKARELRPEIVFGADIIAGFPTETEEMAENTLQLIDECNLTYLHIFPYSANPQTPASRMPQVPKDIIKKRAHTLREAGEKTLKRYLESQMHKKVSFLVESCEENIIKGKTDTFAPIAIETSLQKKPGCVYSSKIIGYTSSHLIGELSD